MIGGYPYFRKHPYIDPFLSNLMDNAEAKVSRLGSGGVVGGFLVKWLVWWMFCFGEIQHPKKENPEDPWDWYIYLHEWVDVYGKWIGKYTSSMDPSWERQRKETMKNGWMKSGGKNIPDSNFDWQFVPICFKSIFEWKHFWVVVSDGLTNVISHTDLVSSFQICFMFTLENWGNDPIWLMFFQRAWTTSQMCLFVFCLDKFDITQQFKRLKSSTQNFKTADSFYRL